MSNLTTIIQTGLNNPDCAFYTGQMFGFYMALKYLIALMIIIFIYKAIDKLAYEPFLEYLKNKFNKKK